MVFARFRRKIITYQRLTEISDDLIHEAGSYTFIREALFKALEPPKKNVVILKGARGIGKSTLIQQFLYNKSRLNFKVFYITADSTLLNVKLAELAHIIKVAECT